MATRIKIDRRLRGAKRAGTLRRKGIGKAPRHSPLGLLLIQGARDVLAYKRGEMDLRVRHVPVAPRREDTAREEETLVGGGTRRP